MPIFDEENFNALLCLERKRTERTGACFVLALLDITAIGPKKVPQLYDALRSQMRQTDIAGWYRSEAVAGIIFTSFNGAPREVIRARLESKISASMQSALGPEDCKKVLVRILLFPDDVDEDLYPDLTKTDSKRSFHKTKRMIDIAGSLTALIVLSPVFLVIAILVKLSSKGPVLLRQKRLGQFGREFDFLKFRTMLANNDPKIHKEYVRKLILDQQKSSGGMYKIRNDPRVTPIGRVLRKTSLDELPQFVNVLRGEMSLVGPRPPISYELENYSCWHKRRVIEVKPGMTGLWQVQGRSRTTFDEMVRLDLRYIRMQSGWLDFKILIRTPLAVLSGDGAF